MWGYNLYLSVGYSRRRSRFASTPQHKLGCVRRRRESCGAVHRNGIALGEHVRPGRNGAGGGRRENYPEAPSRVIGKPSSASDQA
jgi:hypothetical protein